MLNVFVWRIFKFIATGMLIYIGGFVIISRTIKKSAFKIPSDKHILVVGHSMTEHAINDSLFQNLLNLSQSANHNLYTYLKLKYLLRDNSHIDTVFLSFSYNLSENEAEHKWLSNYLFENYLLLMEWEDIIQLLYLPKLYEANHYESLIKYLLHPVQLKNWGGYCYTQENKLTQHINILKDTISLSSQMMSLEELDKSFQVKYLRQIIHLCDHYQVKLFLINTPVYHANHFFNTSELDLYHRKYAGSVPLLDYSNYSIPPEDFRDIIHLNYKGAQKFSYFLKDSVFTNLVGQHRNQ